MAGALTVGTAIGVRNLYCYGSLLPPLSSLDLAGWVALPLAGLLTTDRKHRLHGLFVGLGLGGMILSACAPTPATPTPKIFLCPEPPTKTPTPAPALTSTISPDILATAWSFYTQTAQAAFTPTLTPTAAPTLTPEPTPDVLDRSKLSERANKFYDLYLAMYNERSGWWWKEYGGDDGFTLKDFMAIMWSYDVQLDLDIVVQAMHNRAAPVCFELKPKCNPTTLEGSLVYLSVFAQSAFDRVNRWQPGTAPAVIMDNNIVSKEVGIKIVDAVLTSDVNINELIKSDPMAPFNYGNISLDPLYAKMVAHGWVLKSIPAPSGDTFFVLSVCQDLFYRYVKAGEANLTQQDYNRYCPSIHFVIGG